jgi:hypothetical protein
MCADHRTFACPNASRAELVVTVNTVSGKIDDTIIVLPVSVTELMKKKTSNYYTLLLVSTPYKTILEVMRNETRAGTQRYIGVVEPRLGLMQYSHYLKI